MACVVLLGTALACAKGITPLPQQSLVPGGVNAAKRLNTEMA